MRTFFLPQNQDPEVVLRGDDFHYLIHVLRLKKDDTLRTTDGQGRTWPYHVGRVAQDFVVLIRGQREFKSRPEAIVTLWQCLPKGKKMDLIVRQATEAGVSRIIPLISRYTVVRTEAQNADKKRDRWQRIAREALQQSGSLQLPLIEAPKPLLERIKQTPDPGEICLFFHQERIAGTTALHRCLSGEPERIILLVGPEGGLSTEETDLLLESGFMPVFLGPRILRSETAALYGLAAIRTIALEKSTWRLSE